MKNVRDRIPHQVRLSFFHESLAFFLMQFSDDTIVTDLVRALEEGTLLTQLEELHFLNDIFEINAKTSSSKWFLFHQVIEAIADEYKLTTNIVTSVTMVIVSAIGGNQSPKISRVWSLFITDENDLYHLKLINTDLYNWRNEMLRIWSKISKQQLEPI